MELTRPKLVTIWMDKFLPIGDPPVTVSDQTHLSDDSYHTLFEKIRGTIQSCENAKAVQK